tara:strand:- start:219 stop:401 length:183 start_codon:yes stop_codon:yes gene_type:complete
MSRDSIKEDVVTADVCEAAALSRSNDLEMVVGGGVFMDSFSALRTDVVKLFSTTQLRGFL